MKNDTPREYTELEKEVLAFLDTVTHLFEQKCQRTMGTNKVFWGQLIPDDMSMNQVKDLLHGIVAMYNSITLTIMELIGTDNTNFGMMVKDSKFFINLKQYKNDYMGFMHKSTVLANNIMRKRQNIPDNMGTDGYKKTDKKPVNIDWINDAELI